MTGSHATRGPKAALDPNAPYGVFVEDELSHRGAVEPVATLLLTNRECPFRCVYCDLWTHTLDQRVPLGAIPRQIDAAWERIDRDHVVRPRIVKLYNSGNFFDPQAIPPEDHGEIAARLTAVDRVIVENHPRLCGDEVFAFRDRLNGELEVAMGLETSNPARLATYDKAMTHDDFADACGRLRAEGVFSRAFVLLPAPGAATFDEAVADALDAVAFARSHGVGVVSLVPLRPGRIPPGTSTVPTTLELVERTFAAALALRAGDASFRVFVDLWDIPRVANDATSRIERLGRMNDRQSDWF